MRTIRAASGASGANVGSAARGRNGTRLLKAALVGSFVACSSGGGGPSPSPPSLIETGGASPRSVITPTFGPTVTAPVPPRAISGGTLLATRDGTRAIAADSERDSVYVVNLKTHALDFAVALSAGDEPGRLTEDGAGRIHVALRSGGALATLDPSKGTVLFRRAVVTGELAFRRFDSDHPEGERRPTRGYMAALQCGPLRGCIERHQSHRPDVNSVVL